MGDLKDILVQDDDECLASSFKIGLITTVINTVLFGGFYLATHPEIYESVRDYFS